MKRDHQPSDDYSGNQNQEPTPVCVLPEELQARLEKADGHINAAERKLWYETDRGFWSGDQAKARLAEAWLWLRGEPVQPLPLERYLKKDVLQQRLLVWLRSEVTEPIAAALAELATAEQAIRAEPFPLNLSTPLSDLQRQALYAGIDRQNQYKKALYDLQLAVEDVVAERYVHLHPGDWVHLDHGSIGRVLTVRGLTAWIVAPTASLENLVGRYSLRIARIEHIERPQAPPISAPGYYWLLHAWDKLEQTRNFIERVDLLGVANVGKTLLETLDAAAKAWWVTFAPDKSVYWRDPDERNIRELQGKAPPSIADPLNEALHFYNEFSMARIRALPKQMTGWEAQMAAILQRFEQALAALETLIAPEIDLDPGDWVVVSAEGDQGQIVQRQGAKLVIDRGQQGILEASMFHPFVQRIPAPVDAAIFVSQPWHRRWLWFAGHPEARATRQVCPCCGLPGIQEETQSCCRLCGWRHDGGDFDPERLSAIHDNLTLALGRRRFDALGYAALPEIEAGWRDPLVLVRKRRLIAALDALVNDDAAEDPERLARIKTLWTEYQGLLGSATPTEEEMPDHD